MIKVSDNNYYCVEAGVWFKAPTPQGPWRVADTVPAEIYNIPPSSPIYYVTYVKVYGLARPRWSTSATRPATTARSFRRTQRPWSTARDGITRLTSVPQCGMAGPTPTVWEPDSPRAQHPGGASASATDTPTIPGTTRGGDQWVTTDTAGIPTTAGARGAEPRSPTCTACGATPPTRAPARPGPIPTPATTARPPAARTTTPRPVGPTVAGRGTNTNIYTGNTAGYRGGATYNPNTGIVAGGGAAYAGNIYSGQGTAGRGGFAYNTNTNAGVAAGKNNVYAGKDGTVYKYNRDSGSWSSNSGSGWQSATKPDANLQRQQQMRTQGAQRTQTFNSARSYGGGARMGGGGRRR